MELSGLNLEISTLKFNLELQDQDLENLILILKPENHNFKHEFQD